MTSPGAEFGADVCVVGGGPAGSVAAAQLARSGVSVAVVSRDRRSRQFAYEPLGETIPPAAVFILEHVSGHGVDLADGGHLPWLGRRSSWVSTAIHEHSSIFDVQGHGWRIDRARFEDLLISLAAEQGAQILDQWQLSSRGPAQHSSGWRISLIDPDGVHRELSAAVLVDATGRGAHAVRNIHASGRRQVLDRLVALTIDYPQRENEGPADATSIV